MLKKIVIIGPESTGKSTLSQQLAAHYNTLWCPEYAREYLLKNARPDDPRLNPARMTWSDGDSVGQAVGGGMNYTYDDLLTIAKGQVELEEEYLRMADSRWPEDHRPSVIGQPLFIDTNMYVMKVWCEFVFGKCHPFILDQITERKYDLYLLCNIDLPWIKDELREYPELEPRQRLYQIYKDIMVNQSVPWVEVSGNYDERLQKGIIATDALLKK